MFRGCTFPGPVMKTSLIHPSFHPYNHQSINSSTIQAKPVVHLFNT